MAANTNRPLSIKEMQAQKSAKEQLEKAVITVMNISRQIISVHLNAPPKVDFYIGAEDVRLRPNQQVTLKKYRVRMGQLERLQKTGHLSILSDSEAHEQEDDTKKVIVRK